MRLIYAIQIEVSNRQRKTPPSPERVAALASSILNNTLLHPPVVTPIGNDRYRLIAGGCRLQAIASLARSGRFFICDGQVVQPGLVPVTEITDLDLIGLMEAELSENIDRLDLDWKERVEAINSIHELRKAQNPGQTITQTSAELVARSEGEIGLESARQQLRWATVVAKNLDNPVVAGARNEREAYQLVLKTEEEEVRAELATRIEQPDAPTIIHDDLSKRMAQLAPATFDLILADPPYGIGADSKQYHDRAVIHYRADDSPEHTRSVLSTIIREGFRVTKSGANLFLFCDIDYIPFMRAECEAVGWTPHRLPLVWIKGNGYTLWGPIGFRHGYDLIFWATKNKRGVHPVNSIQPIDTLIGPRVGRHVRVHGAEKPQWLLRHLIEHSTFPGDSVLDPCCGSGSTLIAARELSRVATGIEIDEQTYRLALANVLAPLNSILEETVDGPDNESEANPNGQ